MKTPIKYLSLALIVGFTKWSGAQISEPDMENYSCASAHCIDGLFEHSFDFSSVLGEKALYYTFNFSNLSNSDCDIYKLNMPCSSSFALYGPFSSSVSAYACEAVNNYQVSVGISGQFIEIDPNTSYQLNISAQISNSGYYLLKIVPSNLCASSGITTLEVENYGDASEGCFFCAAQNIPCENCITSFMPSQGKYMVSAWVKEVHSTIQSNYSNSALKISFEGSSTEFNLTPKGQIIDGWQRIEGEIDIPTDATFIHVDYEATGNYDCYFDDIRFFPIDGSMMSYVYDPTTLRLMAQLDERNYATMYEYDEEGKLIRVKKETERGIMTIQENRDNIVKKP